MGGSGDGIGQDAAGAAGQRGRGAVDPFGQPPEPLTTADFRARLAARIAENSAVLALPESSLAPADEARSWQWYRFSRDKAGQWTTIQQTNARIKTALPTAPPVRDYNYDLELEVEEL